MRVVKKRTNSVTKKVIEIQETIEIKQNGHSFTLEAGDRIRVVRSGYTKEHMIEIQEDVRIPQGEEAIVLEKGDRVQVLKETTFNFNYDEASVIVQALEYFKNSPLSRRHGNDQVIQKIIDALTGF